jgi:hypothetical protein
MSQIVELGSADQAARIAAPQLCSRRAQEQTVESLQGRVSLGAAASQAAHPLGRLGVRRAFGTPMTSDQMGSDHHRADSR